MGRNMISRIDPFENSCMAQDKYKTHNIMY